MTRSISSVEAVSLIKDWCDMSLQRCVRVIIRFIIVRCDGDRQAKSRFLMRYIHCLDVDLSLCHLILTLTLKYRQSTFELKHKHLC